MQVQAVAPQPALSQPASQPASQPKQGGGGGGCCCPISQLCLLAALPQSVTA